MKYAVVFERGPTSYGATVPDLPGVFAVGTTLEETRALVAGAIFVHLEVMREDGETVPDPSIVEFIEPVEPAEPLVKRRAKV